MKKILFCAVVFLIVPGIVALLLVSPYLNLHCLSVMFFLLKPYVLQVFGSKSAMWSFVGILTAAIGVLIGMTYQEFVRKDTIKSLLIGLEEEILENVNLLFTGEVERPYHYDVFNRILSEFSNEIVDLREFRRIRVLYDELRYYQEVVKVWRPTNDVVVTEKHFTTCNKFVEFFEGSPYDQNEFLGGVKPGVNEYQTLRSNVIDLKTKNFLDWEKVLHQSISKCFGRSPR